jgi:hypothetical protein
MSVRAAPWPMLLVLSFSVPTVPLLGCGVLRERGGGGGESGAPLDLGVTPTGGRSSGPECGGEVFSGERRPLDLLLMLDISGSMLEPSSDGTRKWAGIRKALSAFLTASRSQGLGVGMQYFPLRKAGVPASCASSDECGPSGGLCSPFSGCWRAWQELELFGTCSADLDCFNGTEDFGPCVPFGSCENDVATLCSPVQERCIVHEIDLGRCVPPPSMCSEAIDCRPEAYASAAVEVGELPAAAPALLASIESQVPSGNTPTGPALEGILAQARRRARAYPDRSVVAVLATDGLPTDCNPLDIEAIAELAAGAALESPPVKTFAIGVFGPADSVNGSSPQDPLNAIARAGGTSQAFEVDTSYSVASQFLTALDAIRGKGLGCTLRLPAPSDGAKLDYEKVNVEVTVGSEVKSLAFVDGITSAGCAAEGGWYYEPNVNDAEPAWLTLCPSTCASLESEEDSSVRIRLGCETIVR